MSSVTVLVSTHPHPHGSSLRPLRRLPTSLSPTPRNHSLSFGFPPILLSKYTTSSSFRIHRTWSSREGDGQGPDVTGTEGTDDVEDIIRQEIFKSEKKEEKNGENSFLVKLAIAVGFAAIITIISIGVKKPGLGTSVDFHILKESSASELTASHVGFSFKAFGHRVFLPEYVPGWIYFWLLMAAGCGLFISEEALNTWVGISLSRMLSLDGTWQSFAESFSRSASRIISTILWVYWGVCISDMMPFYLGKLFRQSGASENLYAKIGVGKERALSITRAVQKHGNLIGFVERFSVGARNKTAFLAGAFGTSPEYFFAGVCCGGLITLPLQLGIGFLMRERPLSALATVATVVGIWTILPYAIAASTALFFYLRRHYST